MREEKEKKKKKKLVCLLAFWEFFGFLQCFYFLCRLHHSCRKEVVSIMSKTYTYTHTHTYILIIITTHPSIHILMTIAPGS